MNSIIFSKDRPAQLDLLLRSMQYFALWIYNDTTVICADIHATGYSLVKKYHPKIDFINEKEFGFKEALKTGGDWRTYDGGSPYTVFFVDDICFVWPISFINVVTSLEHSDVLTYSMRLSPHMDYCYMLDGKMSFPKGITIRSGYCKWEWRNSEMDFAYPMSLDGHVFRTGEIIDLLLDGVYDNPNELEAYLASHPLNKSYMTCGLHNSIINNPNNLVQETYMKNRNEHGDVGKINAAFMEGKRIDITPYLFSKQNSPHVPVEIKIS